MQLKTIGTSGLKIPQVIFGTSSFGNLYQATPEETKQAIVGEMIECAPDLLAVDSAGKYGAGLALESLARGLRHHRVPAERVLISNKLGWRRVPLEGDEPTFEPGVWFGLEHDAVQDISYDGILRCWEEGNQFLAPYDAQLLSVHDPDEYLAAAVDESDRESRWDDILQAYNALTHLRDIGKAKAIGVGAKDWHVIERITEQCDLDWVMLATSFTVYRHESELVTFIESLRERGITVINSAVFHGGFLTGGEFFDYQRVDPDTAEGTRLVQWRDRFIALCEKFETTPAEACVAFGLSPPGISAIALNTSRPQKVAVNARLPKADLQDAFWSAMKSENLVRSDYPYVARIDGAHH